MSASTTDWLVVFQDSALVFVTITSVLLSLAMMGVPLLAAGFGITAAGSWQSVTVAMIILIASGYLFIQIVSDIFDKGRRSLKSLPGKRWKPLSLTLIVLVVCAILVYMKMRSGGGGFGDGS